MTAPRGNRGTLRSPTFKSSVLWLQPWPLAGGIPQARFKRAPAGPSPCLALLHKRLLEPLQPGFLVVLICITVKEIAGVNAIALGKWRVAVRICREGDVWENQMWHCEETGVRCGACQLAVEFLGILDNDRPHADSPLFSRVPFDSKRNCRFSFHVWPNRSSRVFTIVSAFFLFFFLPSHYHYRYYGGHERRTAKEAYNIRYWSTPITTQRKNLGSGAAQFRLDSAIDRMLYQPFPWQLAEQGQSPAVYLHLSPTPCHLVLVPASLCWLKCHLWKRCVLFICNVCRRYVFRVRVKYNFHSLSKKHTYDFDAVFSIWVSAGTICLCSLHKRAGLYFVLTPICRSSKHVQCCGR